jgi:hypothetical protein
MFKQWIDTCCIDKTSSAELSEAINSMYMWYQNSQVCYAYLSDVDNLAPEGLGVFPSFRHSKWWSRGWTLQELLAPKFVEFYARDWTEIGTKSSMQEIVQQVARIGNINATGQCVAEKMSWASHRETTRIEDEAYCLMGIFGINMPLLYGEGEKALFRLQSEIWAQTGDESIFAWEHPSMESVALTSRRIPPLFSAPQVMESELQMRLQSLTVDNSPIRPIDPPIRSVSSTDDLSLFALKPAWFQNEMVQVNGIKRTRRSRNSRREDGGREGLVDAITLSNRGIDMDFSPRRVTTGSSFVPPPMPHSRANENFLLPLYCEPVAAVNLMNRPTDLRCYALQGIQREYGGWRRAPQLEMLSSGDAERARQNLTRRELRAHFPHKLTAHKVAENLNGYTFPGVIFIAPSFKMNDLFWRSIPSVSTFTGVDQPQGHVLYPKVIKLGPLDYWGALYVAMRFVDNRGHSFVLFYEYKIGAWQTFRSDSIALAVQNVTDIQTLDQWWDENLHGNWSTLPDGGKISGLVKLFERKSDRVSWSLGDNMDGLAVAKNTFFNGSPYFKIIVTLVPKNQPRRGDHWG